MEQEDSEADQAEVAVEPEMVEEMTWVPAKKIREFAEMYATSKPATIAQGVSLDHCINGVQNSRAIAALIAITGNLDIPGGSVCNLPAKKDRIIGTQAESFFPEKILIFIIGKIQIYRKIGRCLRKMSQTLIFIFSGSLLLLIQSAERK